jgi:hypothetical protein
MKLFYIVSILFLYVLNIDALLKKRMNDDQLFDTIMEYLQKEGISEPVATYWTITHYGVTEMETNPETGELVNVGHQWIVATPLTEKNGVYDGSSYIKLQLGFTPYTPGSPDGTINTKIVFSGSSFTESLATVLNTGETNEAVDVLTMGMDLGTITEASYQDGANYFKYSSATNCQGFSACQFEKIYQQYINQVGGCSN